MWLAVGRTVHMREQPFRRRFSYPVAMVDLDIDQLPKAALASRFFSVNKANAITFDEADQGSGTSGSLRQWADERFLQAGIDAKECSVRLLCFPRVFGIGFSPLSLWLAIKPGDAIVGIIYEVHNTFGARHSYVAALDRSPDGGIAPHEAAKSLYVSPFFDVSGRYRFQLAVKETRLSLVVENLDKAGRDHVATLMLRRLPLTDATALKVLVRMPFSGLGVLVAIHWQALWLWLRGVRYHVADGAVSDGVTTASPAPIPAGVMARRKG